MLQPKSKRVNRDQYDAVLFDLDGVITDTLNDTISSGLRGVPGRPGASRCDTRRTNN